MTLRYPRADHSRATGFGSNRLDRLSERRDDTDFIHSVRADPAGRMLLFMRDRLITEDGCATFSRAAAEAFGVRWDDSIFLGLSDDGPVFAARVDPQRLPGGLDADVAPPVPGSNIAEQTRGEGIETHNLRSIAIAGILPDEIVGAAAQGASLLGWHATHRFCANCGQPTSPMQAGYRRECPACGRQHFPRTDPVVIMLAVNGERCLLGRQRRFQSGVYSCLAGFMEPGETIEAAVRREIWEESGIRTGRVLYHASQPWPFPSNLMIGCMAEALTTAIDPRDAELEHVAWFDRSDIQAMLAGTHQSFATPPTISIAHHLMTAYAQHGAPAADEGAIAKAAGYVGAMS